MPLFKYFSLIKKEGYGRSAERLCTFPSFCRDREEGHSAFWNPLFQNSALFFLGYGIFTLALVGLLFWGFGFEQVFFTSRW